MVAGEHNIMGLAVNENGFYKLCIHKYPQAIGT